MITSWLYSLFTNNKEQPTIIAPYKVESKRTVYRKLDATDRNNMVTDRCINGMTYSALADKYGISKSGAYLIVKKALDRRGDAEEC